MGNCFRSLQPCGEHPVNEKEVDKLCRDCIFHTVNNDLSGALQKMDELHALGVSEEEIKWRTRTIHENLLKEQSRSSDVEVL